VKKKELKSPLGMVVFSPEVSTFVLDTFGMKVRKKDQVIVYKKDGKPALAIDGQPVKLSEFAGIVPGRFLVRANLPGLIDAADHMATIQQIKKCQHAEKFHYTQGWGAPGCYACEAPDIRRARKNKESLGTIDLKVYRKLGLKV
jgi:hypothetical protein